MKRTNLQYDQEEDAEDENDGKNKGKGFGNNNNIRVEEDDDNIAEYHPKKVGKVDDETALKILNEGNKLLEGPRVDENAKVSWSRCKLSIQPDPKQTSLVFQGMDIDLYNSDPLAKNPNEGQEIPGNKVGPVPVIRFYGVTAVGYSICVHIHGVTPYFYCDPPSADFTDDMCSQFRADLDMAVREQARGSDRQCTNFVLCVLPVMKQSILGYSFGRKRKMLKVFVTMPKFVATCRTILTRGFRTGKYPTRGYNTYESNVPFILRYMVDRNIVGGEWLELPRETYSIRRPSECISRCQIEADVVFENIIAHAPKISRWSRIAPLRTFSFDIECMGRHGHFPDPELDPVIQIGVNLNVSGGFEGVSNPSMSDFEQDILPDIPAPVRKCIFVLGTCASIAGAEVRCFKNEEDLLLAFSQLIRVSDPDIITGYNVQNFDTPYLLNRAKKLGINKKDFDLLGRIISQRSTMKTASFSSSAFGTRQSIETSMEGRIMVDVIQYMYRNQKMSSYSLNAVSAEFLGQQKEDVHHSIIGDLHRGSDEDRRRLAVYCLKDALLPQLLIDKLLIIINYIEMARVTGVPIPFLLSRGQQIKVLSMLYRKAAEHDLVIPIIQRASVQDGGGGGDDDGVGYEGATVIEPKKGFYTSPIATLDFASLYPSIMQAHNLCYTTLINPEDISKIPEEDREESPGGYSFIRASKHKGLLPTILEELLEARTRAKADMKKATDPFEKAVMNGRQLALKISANSVYGFSGATQGSLPCIPISSSVTAYGRDMIEQTRSAVEAHYTVANGYPADAVVVYGDTDSVMVKFGSSSVAEAMKLGLDAAERITKIFPRPVSLEFEKVYYPYLLMNKKRYAGLYWSKPEKWDKLEAKGIETVRRDNCGLVRSLISTCLRKILIDQDVTGAVNHAKETISKLLLNKVDLSLLIISKSLSSKAEDYENKQPHVELAQRMKKRDPGSAPVVGDRVPYVIIQAAKNTPAYLKSEDPIYVLEHNIPIDTTYYLDQQLSKPLERLFESIIPNPKATLLSGEHTLKVHKSTPSQGIGLMRFTVKTLTCLGCKVALPAGNKGPVCTRCEPRKAEIYLECLNSSNAHERRFAELWTQCQRCQGSLHQDVLCTNGDCEIFYMRKKVQKDIKEVSEQIDRFDF